MKKCLLEILICPACLPAEIPLKGNIRQQIQDDILEGELECSVCGTIYAIRDGLAFLVPPSVTPGQAGVGYESSRALASYLWSHYGDLLADPEASDAYIRWGNLIEPSDGPALDIGSAVGRFAFEIHHKFDCVIGIDRSESFIRAARELMKHRHKAVSLPEEGLLNREVTIELPNRWHGDNMEFFIADAGALPFRSGTFSCLASLNLVDKLPSPLQHLIELDRVARAKGSQALVSDPFSWSVDVAEKQHWLGGKTNPPFAGRGLDNIRALLTEEQEQLKGRWQIERQGHVWWKIRTHANHFELIRSCYLKTRR